MVSAQWRQRTGRGDENNAAGEEEGGAEGEDSDGEKERQECHQTERDRLEMCSLYTFPILLILWAVS